MRGACPTRQGYATSVQINQPMRDHGTMTKATAKTAQEV
jgi:hypothetical protein